MNAVRRLPLHLIFAMARNRVIGKDGQLPWRVPEDLRFFKRMTMGHAIVMGRKTFDEVGRPLPGRTNIVVSSRPSPLPETEGLHFVSTVEAALALARSIDPEPFVIGGSKIYAATLPLATHLHATFIDRDVEGDTFLPEWDASQWVETERRAGEEPDVQFVTYVHADVADSTPAMK